MTTSVDKKQVDEEYAKAQALVAKKQQENGEQCSKEMEAVLEKYGMRLVPGQIMLLPK